MGGMSLPPGFRFHPTDDELVGYYLKKKVDGVKIELEVIPVINLYKFDPWELPEKSFLPKRDMEWFFFCPRDRKYPNGSRTNRATKAGYWKATGKDKKINCHPSVTGLRKTLVFYLGRAPAGHRTDWVMHEYRLCEELLQGSCSFQGAFSLCRVIKKNEQGNKIGNNQGVLKATVVVSPSSSSSSNEFSSSMFSNNMLRISEENPSPDMNLRNGSNNSTPITSPSEVRKETELEPQSDIDETNFLAPYLHSGTSKACMDIGDTASKCFFSNDITNTLRTWQPCHNSGIPATSSEIIFSQELDEANNLASISPLTPYSRSISCFEMQSDDNAEFLGLEQLESYQEFPSTEWSDYPYTNSLTDGSASSHPTPTICRQTSGDGPFGDLSNLWIHDDNLVI